MPEMSLFEISFRNVGYKIYHEPQKKVKPIVCYFT